MYSTLVITPREYFEETFDKEAEEFSSREHYIHAANPSIVVPSDSEKRRYHFDDKVGVYHVDVGASYHDMETQRGAKLVSNQLFLLVQEPNLARANRYVVGGRLERLVKHLEDSMNADVVDLTR